MAEQNNPDMVYLWSTIKEKLNNTVYKKISKQKWRYFVSKIKNGKNVLWRRQIFSKPVELMNDLEPTTLAKFS